MQLVLVRENHNSAMAMLRATVLLFLLTSSVLSQTLAPTETDHDTNTIDETIDESDTSISEYSYIDDTLNQVSAIPTCSPDYSKMNSKWFLKIYLPQAPNGVCVNTDGSFVVTTWSKAPFVNMYGRHGWLKKRIYLPWGTSNSGGCVFSENKLFYTDTLNKKILQFSDNGTYEQDFASGSRYFRLAVRGDLLYSTVHPTVDILAFNITTGTVKYRFKAHTVTHTRGLAFDPAGKLHVAVLFNRVETFSATGHSLGVKRYKQIGYIAGIKIDSQYNTILTDVGDQKVYVFNKKDKLIKTISGFEHPFDVALGYQCNHLIVVDAGRGGVYLL